ncbi:MAG: thioesterase [Halobacteriovoraceae bacterium]|nr:thioesterase [Halobacteriovoraceae bacterium]|tara:strand:+ start:190989 stop:191384 length:396 start_codon:yes stop_codon:yes gene_type:complete
MVKMKIFPRFNDTDALGHINNASFASWFEEARRPLFEVFIPDLDPKKWNLIIAKIEIEYLAQTNFGQEVEIKTWLEKVGNSSMTVIQEAWQGGEHVAKGKSIMVHFDYDKQTSRPIPADIKDTLNKKFSAV